MTAAELLKALKGVPDEALPEDFRLRLRDCDHMAPMDDDRHAAVGAMVVWLGEIELRAPDGADESWDVRRYNRTLGSGFSVLQALASACRAVATTPGA